MISPSATRLLIKHFDGIDRAVSRLTMRKRPWSEPGITSYLCDLLDEETQSDHGLDYTIDQLNNDLAKEDGLLNAHFRIDTHEYPPKYERWVTQADIGLVLQFEDYLLPDRSWSQAWLLQAKRIGLTPRSKTGYSVTSRITAVDASQMSRIRQLKGIFGDGAIVFLIYGPRPEFLDDVTAIQLLHLRRQRVLSNIFDYTLGLELHREVGKRNSSLDAGLFVADNIDSIHTLGAIHGSVFSETQPLSWFLVSNLQGRNNDPFRMQAMERHSNVSDSRVRGRRSASASAPITPPQLIDVVKGNEQAIGRLLEDIGEEVEGDWPFLPKHSLTITISVGDTLPAEGRAIRIESL